MSLRVLSNQDTYGKIICEKNKVALNGNNCLKAQTLVHLSKQGGTIDVSPLIQIHHLEK